MELKFINNSIMEDGYLLEEKRLSIIRKLVI